MAGSSTAQRAGTAGDERLDHWGPVVGADLLRRARQLSDVSGFLLEEDHEMATALAALAGVSAADAITCIRLARRSSPPLHHDAPTLLAQADERGPQAAVVLEHLLRLRDRRPARSPVTTGEARRAVVHAAHLVTFAERLAFGPEDAFGLPVSR